jgi:hypothetical protein
MRNEELQQQLAKANISLQAFVEYGITPEELLRHNEMHRKAWLDPDLEFNVGRCRFCGEYEIVFNEGIHHSWILDDKLCPGVGSSTVDRQPEADP